ncbi:MATE family efflux transporter [Brucepastera parasyntrophica]|uniref:MATE family efflux transporter n=1 Tax=Brucepastera parasyntrophica TaxID=2880008 RepID=UPI00210B12DE|nr:MATE family efflux transporter [Brucepastera parasyntrophica]ULQ60638.1 MATE family efflux transporter [Brucepastera parasyntrophica]
MKNKALTQTVLRIALPAVAELILTSLTQFVDTIMVGKIGHHAISAVGLTTQPRFIMLSVFVALNVGTTALVARFKGQENKDDAALVSMQALLLTLVSAIILTIPGVLFSRHMVVFMGADAETVREATGYFRILMLGFTPTALSLVISALLRGVGDTKISMRYNIAANIINIIFNYFLIYGKWGFPELGVNGAALATVLGNTIACGMAFYAISGKRRKKNRKKNVSDFIELRFTRKNCLPDFLMLKRIIKIGLPAAGEQFALRAGLLIYTITITSLGTKVFAAHQIVLVILNLSFVNGQAFGIAAATLSGQALGRKEPDRAKESARVCQHIGSLISTVMGIGMFVFRKYLMLLFTADEEIILLGAQIMILVALLQPFQSAFQIYAGALRGAGDSLYPAISLSVGILIIRPALSYVFINVVGAGLFGAWCALFIDQFVRFIMIRLRFKAGKWISLKV